MIGEEELVLKKQKGELVGFGLMGDQQQALDSHCCCVIPENPQSFWNWSDWHPREEELVHVRTLVQQGSGHAKCVFGPAKSGQSNCEGLHAHLGNITDSELLAKEK